MNGKTKIVDMYTIKISASSKDFNVVSFSYIAQDSDNFLQE